ncbi:MAG: ABC transporter ATP-binding protein [Nitrospinae bacterium RIFCSPLOWO2_12_FULL_47_7]|nr:MAG: ABC transporter ATP-binding protein [Nitrospinae bacterium RIFCSPLOWO2_12_FULL_47_7]
MTPNADKRFERIHIKGFRRLEDIQLELRNLCVLIGANGSGKTSFLDVFNLLAASAEGRLNNAISSFGGFSSILTANQTKQMSIEVSMKVPRQQYPLKYALTVESRGVAYEIAEESMTQQRTQNPNDPFKHIESIRDDIRYFEVGKGKLIRPTWEHKPLETSLSQVPKMFHEPEEFRNRLASSTFYHVLNVEPRSPVRLPQPLQPAMLPGRDGENLISCLFYLRETNRDRFETIEDALRTAFPDFVRLDFPPVAAGTLSMTWKDRNFSHPLFPLQLSEGTLRFLWLATLLQSPGLTAITLLDEPEVSLHPQLLCLLAGLMREASSRTQLIVATHSDRLIRFLKPEEVVAMDVSETGTAQANWADTLDLDLWLKDYTLDEVWDMGRLGARS